MLECEKGLFWPRQYTEAEVRAKWPEGRMRNDRVKSARLGYNVMAGGIVDLVVVPEKYPGCFCGGRVSTANVGFILRVLVQLLGVDADRPDKLRDDFDVLQQLERTPFRVWSWGHAGCKVMETTCIGHFLEDRFVYGEDLMFAGMDCRRSAEEGDGE